MSNNSDDKTDKDDKKITLCNFTKDGFKILTSSIRHSNALPTDSDWNFYKLNESFCNVINNEGDRILRLMNLILKKYDIEDSIKSRKSIEEKIELLIEANDTILESVSDNIDILSGIKKKNVEPIEFQTVTAELPISESWNRINKATFSVSASVNSPQQNINSSQTIHLLTGKNIIRPQKFFKDKIDNSNNYPWQPRITEKPNSIRPLAVFLEETEFGDEFCHPYQTELDQFEPPSEQVTPCTPIFPKQIADTPIHLIESGDKLDELVQELYKHSIIGIDLEHHSYRTFMGITCLMQISTIDADYIIDALELRDKLYVLNEIFTKPSIVKVFHGADCDILWLQRDLSLYIVNMFDTHQAAKQLGYSGLSLAYLLHRFCKFLPNKQFQLADWRIRPLPQELICYAREDTHYLIYIYGILRNELLKQGNGKDNILKSVIQKSTEICKKRYLKPILNDDSHLDFYRKCKRLFDNRQMYALKELYGWRDKIAREEDESTGYVLPNHMMLQISEMLPREMQGILACCNPIPPLVRSHLLELHQIILKAREQSAETPIMKEDSRGKGSTQQFSKINVDSPLYCPHDLTKQSEYRDDLTILMSENPKSMADWIVKYSSRFNAVLEKKKSKYSAFNDDTDSQYINGNDDNSNIDKLANLKFLGPYERYKLVKPYIQAEEEKENNENASEGVNIKQEAVDLPTNDRIASLHEHFLKVAQICPQPKIEATDKEDTQLDESTDQQSNTVANQNEEQSTNGQMNQDTVSLTETSQRLNSKINKMKRKYEECTPLKYMHGAKMRKRGSATTQDIPPNSEGNTLLTPVPNLTKNIGGKRKRNRRRKNRNQQMQPQPEQQSSQQQQPPHQQSQELNVDNQRTNNANSKEKKKKRKDYFVRKFQNNKKQKLNNSVKNEGDGNASNSSQSTHATSGEFTAFDYSTVDYGQFQGGASASSSNKKGFQSKFRGKNKRKFGGKNNKFATFDNKKMKI